MSRSHKAQTGGSFPDVLPAGDNCRMGSYLPEFSRSQAWMDPNSFTTCSGGAPMGRMHVQPNANDLSHVEESLGFGMSRRFALFVNGVSASLSTCICKN